MRSIRCSLAFAALMLMLSLANVPFCALAVDETDARPSIAAAEERILVCYRAVVDADEAGADTSALLAVLNEAGELLSKAKLAYEMGDFNSTLDLALLGQEKLTHFVTDADASTEAALWQRNWDFMVYVIGSLVGAMVVVCGSFIVWFFLKRRYEKAGRMDLHEYRVFFLALTVILALLVASPALGRLLVLPRTEFFTELWVLGPNHMAEGYPFNITRNHNYNVFLGIENRLGYCAYYLVEVKFRNETQSAPDSFNRTPSSLPALFNVTSFVTDEKAWELPLAFSFDYGYNETLLQVELYSLTLNDVALDMGNYTITWDSMKKEFSGILFFELWIYNRAIGSFQYHKRFVSLRFNMTNS